VTATAPLTRRAESDAFKFDATLCDGVSVIIRRRPAGGQLRLFDAWVLLAVASLVDRRSRTERVIKNRGGVEVVSIEVRIGELLDELQFPRARNAETGLGDFRGKAWSAVRDALDRLASEVVEVRYPHKHKSVTRRRYLGSLVTVDRPDETKGAVRITLACYGGVASGFYVLVSREVFALRPHLGDTELRLLLWLVRHHRGRREAGVRRLRHAWELVLSYRALAESGVVTARPDRPGEARAKVIRAAGKLKSLGLLEDVEAGKTEARVVLRPGFFHREAC
jgi:hypothetical protein